MARTAVALRHLDFEDLGFFAGALDQLGYVSRYVDAVDGDLDMLGTAPPDLLVILGGPISANDDGVFPFINQELALIADRVRRSLPTLGICLGAQLIARALGGHVGPSPEAEIGWAALELNDAGRASPLRHLEGQPVLHWHGEMFSIPPGAQCLASTAACPNQAFGWGEHVLALQFHPEVTAAGLEHWYVGHAHELASRSVSVAALRADAAEHGAGLADAGSRLLGEWLEAVARTG
ncbi:MAG: glutamine amidotransferase [Gammaproteobacteria bacterium]|jgi:GMP synthase (glutamine-hydrolysing)